MGIISLINRPEYFFQPNQIVKRFKLKFKASPASETFKLPWGVKISAFPGEVIGRSISAMGVYDLCVSETLWRIIDEGETCVDVGANIGYMTSLMAHRVGLEGKVVAFEPHPSIYQRLSNNVQSWITEKNWTQIETSTLAISDKLGQAQLFEPINFGLNQGTASLMPSSDEIAYSSVQQLIVETNTLDKLFSNRAIGLLKIDVEGHEISVLSGAEELLKENRIRDILFEEHRPYPNPVSEFLKEKGYFIYRVTKDFLKPSLVLPQAAGFHPWEPPCYLATKNVERVFDRFKSLGWKCLKNTAL
ncbi:FkbM family methyltransferase [Leptolyngbya sp. CCNP1308]|uniref:FkbM family methyltransferase n=1 Tax=Leptolyngbya sp. CCNP1308 TaxID=3110255 RepID=UPI002B1FBE10|nr:FkbM family methyltransferase [Leptolyngbya sp. CCNP1308]MEA5448115.1 FkbM family methyltransferase [Leptolyngbya sp. CCNP1308]